MKYLITISYDGRSYCGYQKQKNGVDIYRQDCNINGPSLRDYWKQIQEDGRKGYVENKYRSAPSFNYILKDYVIIDNK